MPHLPDEDGGAILERIGKGTHNGEIKRAAHHPTQPRPAARRHGDAWLAAAATPSDTSGGAIEPETRRVTRQSSRPGLFALVLLVLWLAGCAAGPGAGHDAWGARHGGACENWNGCFR